MLLKPSAWLIGHSGLQTHPIPGNSIVELFGDSRVLVERHGGITSFSESRICIKTSYGNAQVTGNGLRIACISKDQLVVVGCVESVSIIRRG